ncbi:signal peptidase I [Marmoricola sp. URHA0025 HA25]
MTTARIVRLSREVLLTSAAILGVLGLVLVVAGAAFGVRPLMFRSGSMAPTIDTGDLSMSRTVGAADLHRGDIVSVVAADGQRVTHRVVTNTAIDGHWELTLKGDANHVVDQQVYDVTKAQKVMFTLPKAGYVVDWFSRAPGVYLVAAYVGLLLMLIGRRSPRSGHRDSGEEPAAKRDPPAGPPDAEPTGGRHAKTGIVAATVLGLVLTGVAGWTLPTWAAWTDSAAVNGTTFTAAASFGTPPNAPHIATCTVGNGNSDPTSITWTTNPVGANPTTFEVRYTAGANPTEPFAGTLRSAALAGAVNNTSGSFFIVAIGPGGTSSASNLATYSGNGGQRKCVVAP